METSLVAGVDIGGSHITVALVDMTKRLVLSHTWKRLPIDSQGRAEAIITDWCKAMEESFATHPVSPTKLGIAMPGPFDYAEGISLMQNQNKYDALYRLNVKEALASRLGFHSGQIVMTNDAACFLQGEVFCGVAKGRKKVIGLTLGTGLGSARWKNGKAEDADLWCSPFRDGIAEDYLSTRWFVSRYLDLAGTEVKDVKELAELVQHHPSAMQVFNEFGNNLGAFLLPYVLAEKIGTIVLGGNIAHAFGLFSPALEKTLNENGASVNVLQTTLGEDAALVGAASYCLISEAIVLKSA